MKKLLFVILLCFAIPSFAGKKEVVPSHLEFREVRIAEVVQLIFAETKDTPYVIDPEVLADKRIVSFRYDAQMGDFSRFLSGFLESIDLMVTNRDGITYIAKKVKEAQVELPADAYVYRPRYRDGSYLSDLLAPLFKGQFTAKKAIHAAPENMAPQQSVPRGSAAALIDRRSDTLVFLGSVEEIARLKQVLPQVDTPKKSVMVQAILYEVQTSNSDGSAFNIALNLLGGKVSGSLGQAIDPMANVFKFANVSISAVLSNLSSDSRFNVVSTPSLRVTSGETGHLVVGQDVPVLSQVSYGGNGNTPLQSVEYRSSGVIFDLQPIVRESIVDLDLTQQVSNFVSTNTGVNASPTLIKREIKTALSMEDGELVVIGGVAEDKNSNSRSGISFLPKFFQSTNFSNTKTEILLILKLTRI
ncbi:type II secretory pathway, component PulD [Herbaspirillum sp. DW155]|uniref:type II secretion system protein GspD n=1 Tax=Herbaspirillum sp. DW155 TaxID=3095609 RepID=UPI00308D7763|nr:type II secretory pathway, component PulD [Herbaspirillum sp. DW155]